MNKTCAISGCRNDTSGEHTLCELCRRGLYYWLHRRPAEVLERRRKLTMYGGRLDTLLERGNVRVLKRAK